MDDETRVPIAPVQPLFGRPSQPFGDGLPTSPGGTTLRRALRQRAVTFAANRLIEMRYVSVGLQGH